MLHKADAAPGIQQVNHFWGDSASGSDHKPGEQEGLLGQVAG